MPATRRQLFGLPVDGLAGAGVKAAVAVGAVVALDACAPPPAPTKPPLHTYSYRQLNGYRRDLMICDATGRDLTNLVPGVYGRAAWDPKGAWLAVARGVGEESTGTYALWVVTRAGRQLHQITRPASGVSDLDPTFAPDGHTLAFTRDTVGFGSGQGIWVVQSNGKSLKFVAGAAGGITPSFGPDGKEVVYAASDGIRRIAIAGGASKLIVRSNAPWQCTQPTWSPDGKRVAFIRHNSGQATDLCYIGASGGSGTVLVRSATGLETPAWLGDNNSLAYVRFDGVGAEGRSNIALVQQSLGGAPRQIFRPFGTATDMSTWSPVVKT
ncbi:MAG: TolB protein [Mycobacterium sp.]|nr:TolB protein [Mycobacterium sp.]